MKSQSERSHRTSPYEVENTPKRKCMTNEQLNILNPYYAKNDRPTKDDVELLAEAIDIPVQRVRNWFNNRRAKEARLQRNSSQMLFPLSECCWNMNIDDTDAMTDSDVDDGEHESGDAQSALDQGDQDQEALYQEARACVATMAEMSPKEVDLQFIEQETRACVLAMAKMTREEVNAAFILSNLKRRIIVHPPQK
ncbi:uncharacterized protein BJ212DRAFT_1295124 [Suillus subaureus]|uniref:Homeobox domain-containing protein n=1 Tax=Suillus subaureus TaxID=48587 RepID=A0A9P7ELU3_9AGAM|nr:uncharacterized protein BJ212DRAFT_1295124 [Suillus subaureus]KAG1825755.1 hypothetical protein BJ212DRAFT_1295124 [Suillus subaureus]